MSREKYLPGPTDTAALSLGGEGDEDTQRRREAVQAALGHLQRRQGEVAGVPAGILREVAFDVDDGETADSPLDAWSTYVRPALTALDTVESVDGVRWRYAGESAAAETTRAAETADAEVETAALAESDTGNAAKDMAAALEDDDRAAARALQIQMRAVGEAVESQQQAGEDDPEKGHNRKRNRDAALAAGTVDRGPTPSPNESANASEQDSEDAPLDSDRELASRAWTPGESKPDRPRGSTNIDGHAALDAEADETDATEGSDRTCARCDEERPVGERLVNAPVMHSQFAQDDKLCTTCFASLASGQERSDRLDGR